mgnify:CR=1 FL=1
MGGSDEGPANHEARSGAEAPDLRQRQNTSRYRDMLAWIFDTMVHIDAPYTVINMLAFLYQVRSGFSPFFVSVSSIYAHRRMKSSWLITCVSLPVTAR